MRPTSTKAVLLLLVLVAACSRERERDSASVAPPPDRIAGNARCRGVGDGAPLLTEAGAVLTRGLLEMTDLPPGWTAAAPAVAPAADDPLFIIAAAASEPFCATAREYDTPAGKVRVLVATFSDEQVTTDAALRMNARSEPGVSPAIASRRHVTVIAPGDRATSEIWATAANKSAGARDIDVLARAAQLGQVDEFERLFQARVAAEPADAMPWAYRAGMQALRGEFDAAKVSASEALSRASGDAEAEAEALHWAAYSEYSTGATNATVRALAERGLAAARASGNDAMVMRALFASACALSVGGELEPAMAALKESLAIESRLGGDYYRREARTDTDLAPLRTLPEFEALLGS